ncbi:WxcM-like domain-containing protein [uncultured Victivallis sp.]|uniref:WxcM-like domain-containing protein n=1 Tax=uncultured Victivallis sp. TaxID=354118 RepID=UPI0025E1D670|nr:WxcM-like domain-containing protein [uncultured Victivallis sp.]
MMTQNIRIGKNCQISSDCHMETGVCIGDECKISEQVSIGANSVIADGVQIGKGARILPCSYVASNVPPFAIVGCGDAQILGYADAEMVDSAQQVKPGSGCGKTGARFYDIPYFSDLRGALGVIEWERLLPFDVKRIFFTFHVPGSEVRGEHAHKVCEQFLIALHGSLHVIVDDGTKREEYVLDTPTRGLHLPAGCWGIQYKHSPDCVLLVLASRGYEPEDYIRDYNEFLKYKREGK